MKISLIIAVYDKYDYLYCVLKSIEKQTFKNFEVIIAEDCEKIEMLENLKKWKKEFSFPINHVSQEDINFRKCKILNKGILSSKGEHLIFIDGDCILHKKYLENYYKYFLKGYEVVFGRRCELSRELTEKILENQGEYKISIFKLMKPYSKAWTECIYFPIITKLKKRKLRILGSNMGFARDIILKINGFNEDFQKPGIGEDTDLNWRLEEVGAKYIGLKNSVVQYHLWHKESNLGNNKEGWEILEKTKKSREYFTKNGIQKLA